jgi:Phage tail tube protein
MPAGLGGGGSVYVALESVMGTLVDPTGVGGVWVPIISEDLEYREEKYYSPQIRQQTIVSDVQSSYYHIEGNLVLEADPNFAPYFMYASRHLLTKTGASPPYTYRATPGSQGSASTAASGAVARTMSITVVRNGIGFGYAGCVVNTWEETIENGVLRWSLGILGVSEADPSGLGTATWIDPDLFGADAHSIYIDAAGTAPPFASAATTNFNGWTFRSDFNGAAQNRIQPLRSASYIAYGETNASYETELDFISKTDYTSMKNNTTQAIKKESIKGGANWTAATRGLRTIVYRTSFDNYVVNLAGMGDLIMARVTGRAVGIAGGAAYAIECKTPVNIT